MHQMTEKETLKALTIEWLEAWKAKDRQTLERLTAEDMILFSSFFKVGFLEKDRAIQSMMDSFAIRNYTCRFVNILVYKEFAVVNTIVNVSMSSGLAADDDAYQVTDVWRKFKKEWKMVCRQPALSMLIHG
jgi:ketosteroid isomerase-like protein